MTYLRQAPYDFRIGNKAHNDDRDKEIERLIGEHAMLATMPVQNCMHFLMPVTLSDWSTYPVPGVVGVLRRLASGQYEVLDAFDCGTVPGARDLAMDSRFPHWVEAAGGHDSLRFDVFLMPQADETRRRDVLTLLQRSCGFTAPVTTTYAVSAA